MNFRSMKALSLLLGLTLTAAAAAVPAQASEVVGSSSETIANADDFCKESVLGDLAADALCTETGAQVGIVFSGDITWCLLAGDLTEEDVETAFPTNNPYVTAELTPAELSEILETGLANLVLTEEEKLDYEASECGNFCQISGLTLRVDASAPAGERILQLTLSDGTELDTSDNETELLTVLPEAALPGSAEDVEEAGGIRDLFLSYLSAHSPLEAPSISRIEIIGAHENEIISSGFGILVAVILMISAVIALPSILSKKKNPEKRDAMYLTGLSDLKNRKR